MVYYTLYYVSLYVVSFNVILYVTPTPIVPSLKGKGTTIAVPVVMVILSSFYLFFSNHIAFILTNTNFHSFWLRVYYHAYQFVSTP